MVNFLKLLPILLKLGDVTDATKAQYPDGKPFWYAKRFWGAIIAVFGSVAAYYSFDMGMLGMSPDQLADKMVSVAEMIGMTVTSIYGIVMAVKGVLDANKRKAETAKPS